MQKYVDLLEQLSAKGVNLGDNNYIQFNVVTKLAKPRINEPKNGYRKTRWWKFISQAVVIGTNIVIAESNSEEFTCDSLRTDQPTFAILHMGSCSIPNELPLHQIAIGRQNLKERTRKQCEKEAREALSILEQLFWERQWPDQP